MLKDYKPNRLEFLNVIHIASTGRQFVETIAYVGELRECERGFLYSYKYRNKHGTVTSGCGIVSNPNYIGMSSAEIILKLNIERPVTEEEKRYVMDTWDIA